MDGLADHRATRLCDGRTAPRAPFARCVPRHLALDAVVPPETLPHAQRVRARQLGAREAPVACERAPVRPRGLNEGRVESLADALPAQTLVHERTGHTEGVLGLAEPDEVVRASPAERHRRISPALARCQDLAEPVVLVPLASRVERGHQRVVAVDHRSHLPPDAGRLPKLVARLHLPHDEVVVVTHASGQEVVADDFRVHRSAACVREARHREHTNDAKGEVTSVHRGLRLKLIRGSAGSNAPLLPVADLICEGLKTM